MTIVILSIFVLGYLAIAFEHAIKIDKAASALLIGVVCWALYVLNLDSLLSADLIPTWFALESQSENVSDVPLHFAIDGQHLHQTGEIASILFFLMGAMTIVELVDSHESFALITDRIRTRSKRKLFWTVGFLTFFLSAVLDNLTTTIVMVSLLRKVIHDREDRLKFVGLVVIAANAGGAWTVIGDVTTTMLWIKHKIGTVDVMSELFLGSLVCLLVPIIGLSYFMPGDLGESDKPNGVRKDIRPWHQWLFLILGLIALLGVPIFKTFTHLPPYMGMMLSLSLLWVVSELVGHTLSDETRSTTGVLAALKRVDMSSILFFLGILLAVGSLGAMGVLQETAAWLDNLLPNRDIVAVVIGLVSSVVDNVPLVAAGIEMYDLPMNHRFWMLLAYCAGTGGSCLIIGSAAGVAAMGIENINFLWYMKKVGPWALFGYLCGAAVVMATLSFSESANHPAPPLGSILTIVLASLNSEAVLLQVALQLIVIIAAASIGGWIFRKLGQPQVVGEIATGLLLGPSCFGRFSPGLFAQVFPDSTSEIFMILGQLGLIFLMFIVGLEFDFGHLSKIGRTAGSVALAGIALPFTLGAVLAYTIHSEVAAEYSRPGFVLFMATALSITAIPILGRIMMEFGITRTPLGVLTISAAAVDDAIGWILLAAVSAAVHGSFSLLPVLQMLGLTAVFIAVVFYVVRPVVCRWSQRLLTENAGALPVAPFSIVLLLVLTSAAITNWIGIFSIFGPFVLGASLCDQRALQTAIRVRLEEFVTVFFLPVFFTYTGLRTNIGSLDSAFLWVVCGLVVTVAIVGKVVGCGAAARLGGLSWRDSACVAIMMNTRALMGLIAVNIGRELGVIPETIFCMMVVMAIVTTLITAPVLRQLIQLDPP